jgi:hypothetical protein
MFRSNRKAFIAGTSDEIAPICCAGRNETAQFQIADDLAPICCAGRNESAQFRGGQRRRAGTADQQPHDSPPWERRWVAAGRWRGAGDLAPDAVAQQPEAEQFRS